MIGWLRVVFPFLESDLIPQLVFTGFGISRCSSKQADLDLITFDQFRFLTDGFFVRLLNTVFASRTWWALNGAISSVELFRNRNAARALSSIFSSGSGFSSRANVRTEYFRLPSVHSTHPVARWSFTGDCIISILSLLQKAFTSFDTKLVP